MTLHIYCRLISFSCFASIKILSYPFSQNESGKIIVFFSQVDITWSCAYKTIIACLSHLLSHFFASQANTSLAFMPLWLCSCCSFYQECCSLPLVLGKFPFFCKVLVSFPGGTPHSPLLPSHFTQDSEVAHLPAVTHSQVGAFVLPVPAAEMFFPETNTQLTSVPSLTLLQSLPS